MTGPRTRCTGCGVTKDLSEFPLRDASRGTLQRRCRTCVAANSRAHYRAHTARYLAQAALRNENLRTENNEELLSYLASHPCVDCGESDPTVLEFDHRDPRDKSAEVSRLLHTASWSIVRLEIDKCDVRCGNCHRRRTAKQFGWSRQALHPHPPPR